MSTSSRIPKPVIRFNPTSTQIATLVGISSYGKENYPWATRFIGQFPLPSWQRGLVWTIEQNISFIESVYIGYDLGSIMINDYEHFRGSEKTVPLSDIIIDGQQRINALISYTNNEFKVLGFYWRELNRIEKRTFLEREIGKKTVRCFDESKLKHVYNHLNFSGVQHKSDERA
ncbi:DUF262 domain-containing protein [Psychromonas sp. SP041]|uniref:DUF262 domain-containing protein n=1 Tax=Psychromonas sp. SP041 TaxID=1365007 RepID=UPI00040F54E2|nr:DUF262 domain-containing protein [Psychromonas sp. SP041]